MGVVQELVIQYRANVTGAVRGLEEVNKQVKRTNQQVDRSVGALTSKLNSVGRNLTIGVTAPIVLMGKAAVTAAMDAVESENLFAESMGKMATEARMWSEQVSKSLGLNSYEIRKQVSTFNVMLESMKLGTGAAFDMAKGLTQLSYDMASFYNLRPEEAFEKLQAGISGETEPLKRLGILVNETTAKTYAYTNGIAKNGSALTEQQKVLARYGVIMESTSKAQGDMARTIDSPTNALRSMKAQIQEVSIKFGTSLLPTMEKVIKKAKDYTNAFAKMSDGHREYILKAALVAAAAGPIIIGFSAVVKAIMTLRAAYITLAASATAARVAQLAAVAGPAGIVAAAGGAAIAAGMNQVNKGDYAKAKSSAKAATASDKEMIKRGFVRKSNGGWLTPAQAKKQKAADMNKVIKGLKSSKTSGKSIKPANPFKLPGTKVVPKGGGSDIATITDLDDAPTTIKKTADDTAQESMSWLSDSYTLKRITPAERIAGYKRILARKGLSLSMQAQATSALWQAEKEIEAEDEEKRAKATEIARAKAEKDAEISRKKHESLYNNRFADYEARALGLESKGNTTGADRLRNKASYMAETFQLAAKGKEGYDVSGEMKLAKAKFDAVNDRITKDNARNIWERIKAYRQEAEEKRKSIAEMMEAERQRQRSVVQFINPGDIWRQLMVDSVRRQFGGNRNTYVPGDINRPATQSEVDKAQLDIRSEAQEQTSLLGLILDKISPIVPAWEQ